MKITMYELLGLVKDGKAPKKIKYIGYSFEYDTNHKRYESYFDEQIWALNDFVNVDDNLNDIVEIIEEKKIPEKLDDFDIQGLEVSGYSMTQAEYLLEDGVKENREMINWILDYLKSRGE